MFAESQWHGSLALYMPKPDKNDASNGLILGYEVLRKGSNFFQKDFKLGLDPKNCVGRRFDPQISPDGFLGSLGH